MCLKKRGVHSFFGEKIFFIQREFHMLNKKPLRIGRTPNTFVYNIIALGLVLPFARAYFGIHVKRDRNVCKMKGPLVCVGNHPSYLDPFVMAAAIYGRKMNIVAGAYLFRDRFIGPLFASGGSIPKVQFRSDARAVKAMLNVLKNGGTLGIFPEGTRFVDGTNISFDDGLARMIKKTNSGVAFLESHGAYMTWPRWSTNSFRRGRIEGGIKKAYSVEEVQAMSVEELQAVMLENLTYNEYDWLRGHPRRFRSKAIAAGAENIAYVCPRCESENKMVSEKDILRCTVCGNRARMDESGFFHPAGEDDKVFEDLHLWTKWERERLMARVQEPDFTFEESCRLLVPWGEFEYREVGHGVVRIENGQVVYKGTECAVENGITYSKKELKSAKRRKTSAEALKVIDTAPAVTKTFLISHIRGLSADYGKRFELTEKGGQINRFILKNGQRIFELQVIIQCLQELDEGKS